MFINEKKHTIELSKKEAKAAAKFGTAEYKNLQEARRDYPTFSVKTVSQKPATKKNTYKGLTYEYMEMYIETKDASLFCYEAATAASCKSSECDR